MIYKLCDWSSGPQVLKDGLMDVVLGPSKKKGRINVKLRLLHSIRVLLSSNIIKL